MKDSKPTVVSEKEEMAHGKMRVARRVRRLLAGKKDRRSTGRDCFAQSEIDGRWKTRDTKRRGGREIASDEGFLFLFLVLFFSLPHGDYCFPAWLPCVGSCHLRDVVNGFSWRKEGIRE